MRLVAAPAAVDEAVQADRCAAEAVHFAVDVADRCAAEAVHFAADVADRCAAEAVHFAADAADEGSVGIGDNEALEEAVEAAK